MPTVSVGAMSPRNARLPARGDAAGFTIGVAPGPPCCGLRLDRPGASHARRASAPASDPSLDTEDDDPPIDDAAVVDEDDTAEEELAESGVDLTEASELDADNVLADEESAWVVQAPD